MSDSSYTGDFFMLCFQGPLNSVPSATVSKSQKSTRETWKGSIRIYMKQQFRDSFSFSFKASRTFENNLFKYLFIHPDICEIQYRRTVATDSSLHRQIGSYSTRDKGTDKRDWVNMVTKVLKSASPNRSMCGMQILYRQDTELHPGSTCFCQTLLSMCLLFSQEESVCSMCSQSMLTSLVSILQSDSLSDWSICSSFVSPCGSLLLVAGFRNGPSEPSSPACPVAHRTVSLA